MEDAPNIAIFCDFENVAIGVRDAKYDQFDIQLVLERLLDKGKIVVKKAYADWDRYRSAKRPMHEAAFELIEIPHLSYSGKNSADIRMVVDALDLCYTKAHVDTFVVISGDSDFSPLVSKLRENNKQVVGLGVKQSTSDLLVDNCDDFIYYDDLVRDKQNTGRKSSKGGKPRKSGGRREPPRDALKDAATAGKDAVAVGKDVAAAGKEPAPAGKEPVAKEPVREPRRGGEKKPVEAAPPEAGTEAGAVAGAAEGSGQAIPDLATRKEEALELVLDTVESLFRDRDDNLWGSMVKQTIKRKRPHFSESYHGYQSFNQLLEEARDQGLLEIQKDEKSGGYLILSFGPNA